MGGTLSKVRQSFSENWWTVQRFGLSSEKIWSRLSNNTEPKILCISIPKAGTHLLERALCLHPRLYRKLVRTVNDRNIHEWGGLNALLAKLHPGEIIISHLRFTAERLDAIQSHDVKCLFLIRDPRDVVISQAFYIPRTPTHYLHDVFAAIPDLESRVKLAIEGYPPGGLPSVDQRLKEFAGWLESGALVVRFEDLIGAQGRGEKLTQLSVLRSMYEFLQLRVEDTWIDFLSQSLFSDASPTFRKGAIGQWRQYFDTEIKEFFHRIAGESLVQYGYEESEEW